MKLALIGVEHWHVPLYARGLERTEADVIAVSSPDETKRAWAGSVFGGRPFADWKDLLSSVGPDFVFAFGVHAQMPQIALALIDLGIPFAIEKPCGTCLADVEPVRRAADEKGVYCSIPLIYAISPLFDAITRHDTDYDLIHLSIKNIAGPPGRYVQKGVPWMLDPDLSGGGCLINFGVHFIDLALKLASKPPVSVAAHISDTLWHAGVEDHASVILGFAGGGSATFELGYSFPSDHELKREFALTYRSRNGYHCTSPGGMTSLLQHGDRPKRIEHGIDLDTDSYYTDFVTKTIAQWCAGGAPPASLADLVRVMAIVDACYVSARTGQVITLSPDIEATTERS